MKRMLIGVRTCELRLSVRMRPEHVVVNEQIVIAEGLGGLGVILDGLDIITKFCLGKHDAVVHGLPPRMHAADTHRVYMFICIGKSVTRAYSGIHTSKTQSQIRG